MRDLTDCLVRLARDDADIETARALCRDWFDWYWDSYPDDWPREDDPDWIKGVEHPVSPARFGTILAELPQRHERPGGGIFLAFLDDTPVGCVMYNGTSPGSAEFHRMFVTVAGRGHGLGRKLLEQMFAQMRADGYSRVFFSSATFLEHARRMYQSAGFTDMAHPESFPVAWRDKIYFMERALV